MSKSSLNHGLEYIFGILLGLGIAIWVLRGFEILTFIPGGIILLLFLLALAVAIANYLRKIWWRF
jgi:hypothetical protein